MDIEAKTHFSDRNGVRIAELDEMSYRRSLWSHRPLTDSGGWEKGTQRSWKSMGLYTMGDIARCSEGKPGDYYNEKLLYQLFGVNAELLIDHAWGWEPCFLASIFPHFHRYDSLKSALYIHAVSKNINTFPKNQGRIRAAIAVKILDFTVMYR